MFILRDFPLKRLGELVEEVRYGTSLPATLNGKYGYLRMNNITEDARLNIQNLKHIDVPEKDLEKYVVSNGDVLFNRTNSMELVGKTCIYELDFDMVIAGYIIRIRTKKNIVGFFGDSMQAIYDSGVGDLSSYNLIKIAKAQNRRNPKKVIDLANKFRDDGLVQTPSSDDTAPNMDNGSIIPGIVKFIYGNDINQLEILRGSQLYRKLEFNAPSKTKELRLTHKLNAEMAGFSKLFELYNTDLFVKLITGIKKKINENKIVDNGKSFKDLVEEAQIVVRRGGPLIVDEIKSTSELSAFYDEIKTCSFEEVSSKSKINKESLLSYKFNGLSSRYEAGTDRDRILKRLDLVYELVKLYKTGKHNEFLRITKFKITSSKDKISRDIIDNL